MTPPPRHTTGTRTARRRARQGVHPSVSQAARERHGLRWWHLIWALTVGTSMALAAAFALLLATATWVAAAVIWVAFLASLPISGMAVAIPVVSVLSLRLTVIAAAATLAATVPLSLWSAAFVLGRIDSGADVLTGAATLLVLEVWTLATILLMAAGLTLISAVIQGGLHLLKRR